MLIITVLPENGEYGDLLLAMRTLRARHLPLILVLSDPLLDATAPYESVEQMAGEYLAAVREVQPRGPYLLAGWCLGGKTAFEMANQLEARGERAEGAGRGRQCELFEGCPTASSHPPSVPGTRGPSLRAGVARCPARDRARSR